MQFKFLHLIKTNKLVVITISYQNRLEIERITWQNGVLRASFTFLSLHESMSAFSKSGNINYIVVHYRINNSQIPTDGIFNFALSKLKRDKRPKLYSHTADEKQLKFKRRRDRVANFTKLQFQKKKQILIATTDKWKFLKFSAKLFLI